MPTLELNKSVFPVASHLYEPSALTGVMFFDMNQIHNSNLTFKYPGVLMKKHKKTFYVPASYQIACSRAHRTFCFCLSFYFTRFIKRSKSSYNCFLNGCLHVKIREV